MSISDLEETKNGFIFKWKIKNFSFCSQKEVEYISSPVFRVEMLHRTEWKLNLHTNGSTISIFIIQEKFNSVSVYMQVDLKCSILKRDDHYLTVERNGEVFNGYHSCSLLLSTTIDPADREVFLRSDTLTIHCHLSNSDSRKLVSCNAVTQVSKEEYWISFPAFFSADKYCSQQSIIAPLVSTSNKYPDLKIVFKTCSKNTIFAIHLDKCYSKVYLKLKLLFKDIKGITIHSCEKDHIFNSGEDNRIWEFSNSATENHVLKNVKAGFYTMHCQIGVSDNSYTSFIENTIYETTTELELNTGKCHNGNSSQTLLSKNLRKWYSTKTLCDFTIKSNGKEFPIHKAALGTASPVFCAMFEREMSEKKSSIVTIDDVDPDILSKMIDFAYTESMDIFPWDFTLKLYSAADKYQIEDLKSRCAQVLKSSLTTGNVCDVLLSADLHQDSYLLKSAQNFIYENSKEMFRSDTWKVFMENNLELASEVMHVICLKFSSH